MSTAQKDKTPSQVRAVAAYLAIKDADAAIAFYRDVFGAVEALRLTGPGDKVAHAELRLGETRLLLSDEFPDFGALSPISLGGSPVKFTLEVTGVDAFFTRALEGGCVMVRSLEDQFYGYRGGMVSDPFGYHWFIQEKREDLTPAEMQARWQAAQVD